MSRITWSIFLAVALVHCANGETPTRDEIPIFRDGVKDYEVYWNAPTVMCHKHGMNFTDVALKYGIIQNKGDSFRGNKISLLYDPGMFPALLKYPNGSLYERNGGLPQYGNLTKHLKEFERQLNDELIPDRDFDGVAIIDFESWRPIFRQNWGVLQPYRKASIDRENTPGLKPDARKKEAIKKFEKHGRPYMEDTLKLAKELRPKAKWGYYAYPYCFSFSSSRPTPQCDPQTVIENDGMSWLFGIVDAHFPSVYQASTLTSNEKYYRIESRVKEALRLARKSEPSQKVLPYFGYVYQDKRDTYLSKADLQSGLQAIADLGADGYILWGSSDDFKTKKQCEAFYEYLTQSLGPIVVDTRKNNRDIRVIPLKTNAP